MRPSPKTFAGDPTGPVFRSLTIVGGVLRIDRTGTPHAAFQSGSTLDAEVEVIFVLVRECARHGIAVETPPGPRPSPPPR
ncbi:MAG: hypothetical protein IT228_08360 [Flavobacteriales bacterium]|nr:hypothetical protein [Flavobacteriales bacterium]